MAAIFFDLSEQFLANRRRFKHYGVIRTVIEVGYEMAKDVDVRFVVFSPAHGQFFEVTPRFDEASTTGLMDSGLPLAATPIRVRRSFPSRNLVRDSVYAVMRAAARFVNRRRWQSVPKDSVRPVDLNGQILVALGRPKIMSDYLVELEQSGTDVRMVPLLHDMIPLHDFNPQDQKVFRSHFRHDNASVIRHSSLVLANSNFTRDEIVHFVGQGRLPKPPNVVSVPLAHELRTSEEPMELDLPDEPYLICVGIYTGRKNLECVAEALLLLAERNLPVPHLVLAGARRKRAERYVAQKRFVPLRDKIHFCRNPNQTELQALYERALALVIPSHMEGWGLPVGEALWVGTPVLASNAPALEEVGGELARYFDPNRPEELADLIHGLQSDAIRLRSLRDDIKAARPRLRTWRDVAEEILLEIRAKVAVSRLES